MAQTKCPINWSFQIPSIRLTEEFMKKMEELRKLEKNWAGQDVGEPIDQEIAQKTKDIVLKLKILIPNFVEPWICPCFNGTIGSSWIEAKKNQRELEIEFRKDKIEIGCVDYENAEQEPPRHGAKYLGKDCDWDDLLSIVTSYHWAINKAKIEDEFWDYIEE